MLGIGMPHLLLLAAIALIAIGPKQLPEVARVIGRFLNDLKKVRDEFTRTIVESRDNVNQNFYNDAPIPPPVIPPPLENTTEVAADEHNQMAFDIHQATLVEPKLDSPMSDPSSSASTADEQKKDS